ASHRGRHLESGVRLALPRRAAQGDVLLEHDRQPHADARHQHPLQRDPERHGDMLQSLPRRDRAGYSAALETLRLRAGDHREGAQARPSHLRSADLVQWPRVGRGQEDHVERRRDRDVDAVPVPLHGMTPLASRARLKTPHAPVLLPALVILVGALLRIALLGVDARLHPDEALFAAQARTVSAWGDVLLRGADLDKPPLAIYSLAASFALLEPSEFAARLPNVFASVLMLAVLYRLTLALSRDRATAALAALLLALSAYDLAFAATAFTDVQATLWA